MMEVKALLGPQKPLMRELIEAVLLDQGLHAQFYWPQELLGAEMATAEALGVFVEGALAGFVLYRDLPGAWEISLVVSHPGYRRRGCIGILLEHLAAAKGHNRELWLEVHEENVPAQKLYEKLGFREVRRRPRYYKDGATAILYARA